jgi:hypothetical protein
MSFQRSAITKTIVLENHPSDSARELIFDMAENKTKLKIYFGDLFQPDITIEEKTCVIPCIVNIADGVLYNIWKNKNNGTVGDVLNTNTWACKVSGNVSINDFIDITNAILFKYPTNITKWDEVFNHIAELIDPVTATDTILMIPTFGTNNGISYHDSALGIFTGLRFCLENNSVLCKLKEIHIVTPFNQDQNNSSCRTICHMFNMIDIMSSYDVSTGEGTLCSLCAINICDTVLPCGHHILCKICELKIAPNHGKTKKCLLCKKSYQHVYNCLPPSEVEVCHPCCAQYSIETKSQLTYIPCGHTSVMCNTCENATIKVCKICNTDIEHKLHVYH